MSPLVALLALGERLVSQGLIPEPSYSRESISFCIEIDEDGQVVNVQSLGESRATKRGKSWPTVVMLDVPRAVERTSGTAANFLWDKTGYALGVTFGSLEAMRTADTSPKAMEETAKAVENFEAFKARFRELIAGREMDAGLAALGRFLDRWHSCDFLKLPDPDALADTNVVFRLVGEYGYVHESSLAQEICHEVSSRGQLGICLLTGKEAPIATIHPAIKGVGTEKSGAKFVTFDKRAWCSFGNEKGFNAPVSKAAASLVSEAANYLLASPSNRVDIGDVTAVFWADTEDRNVSDVAENLFRAPIGKAFQVSKVAEGQIKDALELVASGVMPPELRDLSVPFKILGLSCNKTRLMVRFWIDTDINSLLANLSQHYSRLQLEPPGWKIPPTIEDIVRAMAPIKRSKSKGKGKSEETISNKPAKGKVADDEDKRVPTHLIAPLIKAVMFGQPYPASMLPFLLQRIRSDRQITPERVSIIKALTSKIGDVPMSIDKELEDIPYRLGRLFAVIEKAQQAAIEKVASTVSDKYIATASTSPLRVFPILMRNYRNHVSKLRKTNEKTAVFLEKMVDEIINKLPAEIPFPAYMTPAEQGRFMVGYYHQKEGVIYAKRVSAGIEEQDSDNKED